MGSLLRVLFAPCKRHGNSGTRQHCQRPDRGQRHHKLLQAVYKVAPASGKGGADAGEKALVGAQLAPLNIMGLHSPETAILSAIIFNAVIIPILIPLALRGVRYKPIGASALLRRNLLIYGLGGVIAPFIGIKLIDMFVSLFF